MNPRAVALILLAVAVALFLLYVLAVWLVRRQAGVRRAEFNRVRRERDVLAKAMHAIELRADLFRDIDSPLATAVRDIIRQSDVDRMEINK